jgi:ligand-binding sensor domain-containing protein
MLKKHLPAINPMSVSKATFINFRQVCWFLVLFAISIAGRAQKHRLSFDHLTSIEGLSQSNVLCIIQDSRGYMWFGTQDGLNKYDGYEVKVYRKDPSNRNSLSNDYIKAIAEDKQIRQEN